MTEISRQSIFDLLEAISDPHTGTSLGEGKSVSEVTVDGSLVEAKLTLGYPARGWHAELDAVARKMITQAVDGPCEININIETKIVTQ